MIALPALLLAFAGATLVAALAALFRSLRAAFGGDEGFVFDAVRDLPDQAALVEEKNALLRAIKDLEQERALGKIGEADFARLDAVYRARAKQVLAELDRDVRPLYEQAEKLIEAYLSGEGRVGTGKPKKNDARVDREKSE